LDAGVNEKLGIRGLIRSLQEELGKGRGREKRLLLKNRMPGLG